jgi:hypothetical protein
VSPKTVDWATFFFLTLIFAPKPKKKLKMATSTYFGYFPSKFPMKNPKIAQKFVWQEVGFVIPTM